MSEPVSPAVPTPESPAQEDDALLAEAQPGDDDDLDAVDPYEASLDEALDTLVPFVLESTIVELGTDRDDEVVEELTLALKATEVEPVKEALAEAAIHNLSKHPAAKKAEAWLQDLKVEIRMFDVIREQKKITTENNGSTELLKLLGKAWDVNLPLPGKGKKKPGGPGSGVRPGHVELSEGLHVDADFTDPVTLAAEKEQLALAARTKEADGASHFDMGAVVMGDDDDENNLSQGPQGVSSAMVEKADNSGGQEADLEAGTDDDDDSESESSDESSEEKEAEAEPGQLGHHHAIDVLGQWRMRVPRHTKLIKDCLALLTKCTSRLALTADPAECVALYRWMRHVATVGDAKSFVELVVMTDVMHLELNKGSPGNRRTMLHYAASEGNLKVIRHLLHCHAQMDPLDCQGNTPLHLAAASNQAEACQILVYKGADTAQMRNDGCNALHVACLAGAMEAVKALLSFRKMAEEREPGVPGPTCVDINKRRGVEGNHTENTPLLCAALGMPGPVASGGGWRGRPRKHVGVGDYESEDEEEKDIKSGSGGGGPKDAFGAAEVLSNQTVFHEVTVRLLLEWGADFKIAGEHGTTLLHIICGNHSLVKLFNDLVDEHNFTLGVGAKSTPAIAPHPEEVAVVEEEEEDPDADLFKKGGKRKEETKSSLKRAQLRKEELARRAQQEADAAQAIALKFKWQRVLNVNVTNGDGNTPLHVALYNRNDDLAKVIANSFYCDCDRALYLKDMRRVHNPMEDEPPCTCRAPPLNVNVTNDYGYTPLHVACRHHDMDMVRLLLSRGANKNRLASLSGGPLHVAVSVGGAVDIVRVLVKAGADVHLRNNQHGRTPLHVLACDSCRPWDNTKGALRPMEPLLYILLDLMAHANDKDREGRTALALAVLRGKRLKTVQVLLRHRAVEAGATPEDPNPMSNPFGLFSESQRTGALTSDPDLADLEGKTPLYHAVSIYRMDLAEALMDANDKALALAVAEVTGRAAETETAAAEKAEKDRLAAIKAAKEAKKAANSNKGGGKKGKKKKSGGGDEASKEEAEEALPIEASAAVAAGDDGGENDGDGDKVDDASSLDLTQRGALVHQTKKGLTVFHLAAEMPKTKPSEAVVVMRTLMERLARAPPGYGVFVESASSSDGGGDALALAAEGGSEGGAGKKLEWETWPQEEDTGHTAWHKVVRHKNSPKEVADQQNARAEAKEAESAFKAMNPGQPYHPPPLPQSTYKVAIDVLKIMLSMRAYDPSREQAAAGSPNKGKTTGGGGGGEGIRRNLAIQDLDGETVLHTALILNQLEMVQLLLDNGDTHDLGMKARTTRSGRTALVLACDQGLLEEAARIVELGARVNEADRKGNTPLIAAVRMGAIGGRLDGLSLAAMKRQAIDNGDYDGGASIASNESSATTVIDTDEENCKMDLVEMLLESGADPKIGNEVRDTPLHFACEQFASPIMAVLVKLLIAQGADVSKANTRKDTPLHIAIENCDDSSEKSKSVITALCEAKADCQAKNRKRRTPYELAVELEKPALAEIIANFDEFAKALQDAATKKGKKGKRK